jgi:hypothetical protein
MLKRASASRPSGQWSDEDYDVLADGKVVGRILEEGSRFGPRSGDLFPPILSWLRLRFARWLRQLAGLAAARRSVRVGFHHTDGFRYR